MLPRKPVRNKAHGPYFVGQSEQFVEEFSLA
jgi:hypothetical protein